MDEEGLLGLIVVIWLIIGVIAAAQRGYFGDDRECQLQDDQATPC